MDAKHGAAAPSSGGLLSYIERPDVGRCQHYLGCHLRIVGSTGHMSERLPSATLNAKNDGIAGAERIAPRYPKCHLGVAPDEGVNAALFFTLFLCGRSLCDIARGVLKLATGSQPIA